MTKTFFLVLILVCSLTKSSVSTQDHLRRGSSLSVNDDEPRVITSPDKTFTCGFYGLQTNAYWFAIWFTNSRDRTVVWTANRNKPVNGRGSKVTFRRNGAVVLTDVDGMVVWETNTTATNANRAELLNTGNLVLKNKKGLILWESFDSPTDTLLPFQTLTKSKSLISASRKSSFESGYYGLSYNSINVLTLSYDGPEISSVYWPSPDPGFNVWAFRRTTYNSTRIASFNNLGVFNSSDGWQFNASDSGFGIVRRLTMDHDGNLRMYSLSNSTGLWSVSWQAIAEKCNVHGLCGRNGICVHGPKPECQCPPGYEPNDLTDSSRGCKSRFNACLNSSRFEFVELPKTDYYGFDLNFSLPISFEDCRRICSMDCRCEAFSYRLTGEGVCYAKSALFNGYRYPNFIGNIYLKVPIGTKTRPVIVSSFVGAVNESDVNRQTSLAACGERKIVTIGSESMYESPDKKVKWVYLYSFALATFVVEALVIVFGWWIFFGKNGFLTNLEDGYRMISSQFRGFRYDELVKATQNFKFEIGRGGSGVVYKGVLEDERVVAVKRLNLGLAIDDVSQEGELWAEVSTIGKINHMNVVRMWGFCSQKQHKLVVYEYVENLSLDKKLFSFSRNFLLWNERFKVAIGVAKGLAYLHHECLEWVIHCDIKPENILLDTSFEPKIADFGLAKLSQRGGLQNSEFTKIRGTKGYMAPEWGCNLPITAKVDVYSFGVVVLELVKGIRLSTMSMRNEKGENEAEESELVRFLKETKRRIEENEDPEMWIEKAVDSRLGGVFSRKQAVKLVEIGINCVEEDRNKRPTMDCVVQVLNDLESD